MDLPLFYETSLVYIIVHIMEQSRVKCKPYHKFLYCEAICYNEEAPFCLISKTTVLNLEIMDVINTL